MSESLGITSYPAGLISDTSHCRNISASRLYGPLLLPALLLKSSPSNPEILRNHTGRRLLRLHAIATGETPNQAGRRADEQMQYVSLSMLFIVSSSDKHMIASDGPGKIQPQLPAARTNFRSSFDWLFLPFCFMPSGSHL